MSLLFWLCLLVACGQQEETTDDGVTYFHHSIADRNTQEIQNKFALPNTPKYICDVNLEAVTRLRTGEVNPLFGFDGGGQQYDLIINGKNVGTFTNERIIGQ